MPKTPKKMKPMLSTNHIYPKVSFSGLITKIQDFQFITLCPTVHCSGAIALESASVQEEIPISEDNLAFLDELIEDMKPADAEKDTRSDRTVSFDLDSDGSLCLAD